MADLVIIKDYLVALGFKADEGQFNKVQGTLKTLSTDVERVAAIVGKRFIETGAVIGGVYAAIGTATVGLIEKISQGELGYQLMAMKMYMSVDAAKKLTIAQEALGKSLDEIAWNKELTNCFIELVNIQKTMQYGLGGDYTSDMQKVRDIRFEFTKLGVEAKYVMMGLADSIFKAFGGKGDILAKMQAWNTWIQTHIPLIRDTIAKYLNPVLKDAWDILKNIGLVLFDIGIAFSDFLSIFTGDNREIDATTSKFERFGIAMDKISHAIKAATDFIKKWETAFLTAAGAITGVVTGTAGGALLGGIIGSLFGIAGGPAGIIAGGMAGSSIGGLSGGAAGGVVGGILGLLLGKDIRKNQAISNMIGAAETKWGLPPGILQALIHQESGGNQSAVSGKGAIGLTQLMPGTAREMGVDPYNAAQNVEGGSHYLSKLYAKYMDLRVALAAYNAGPGAVDRVGRDISRLSGETQNFVNSVMNFYITGTNSEEIKRGVLDAVKTAEERRARGIARNLAEFSGPFG